MSNELNMNNIAGKLHQFRKQSTANYASGGSTTSSDSESDIEDGNDRRLSGKSSVYSMMSRKSNITYET